MIYSRALFGTGRGMKVSLTPSNRARIIAYDKNTPGATSLLGTSATNTLIGVSDTSSLKGTAASQAFHSAKKQKQEKENYKNAGIGIGKDPNLEGGNSDIAVNPTGTPDLEGGTSDEYAHLKDFDPDKAWYYPYGADRQVSESKTVDQFTGYSDSVDRGDKDGWRLFFSGTFKNGDGNSGGEGEGKSFLKGKLTIEGGANSILKITAVNDVGAVKLPTHPLENGMVKHDHKVIQPKTLRVVGLVKRTDSPKFDDFLRSALAEKSLGAYFSLMSPWKNRTPLYLRQFTSRANTQRYDVFEYVLELSELLIAQSKTDKTDKPELTSENNKGGQGAK